MDNPSEKRFNKKRFVYFVIAVIMFIGAIITFQKWWPKAGIGMSGSSNIGSMYFLDDILYYGSKWHGICAYNEKTSTDSILIKNADGSFLLNDEYIYYRKGNKDYKYNIHTGKIEKSEKRNQKFYYTYIEPSPEVSEIFREREDNNIPGDISYAILSEKYFYAKRASSGGYISVCNIEDGKVVVVVDGEYEEILKYSYSPVGMFMSGSGGVNFSSPTNMLWFSFIFLPIPFLIIGIIFIKKWKRLKNN